MSHHQCSGFRIVGPFFAGTQAPRFYTLHSLASMSFVIACSALNVAQVTLNRCSSNLSGDLVLRWSSRGYHQRIRRHARLDSKKEPMAWGSRYIIIWNVGISSCIHCAAASTWLFQGFAEDRTWPCRVSIPMYPWLGQSTRALRITTDIVRNSCASCGHGRTCS